LGRSQEKYVLFIVLNNNSGLGFWRCIVKEINPDEMGLYNPNSINDYDDSFESSYEDVEDEEEKEKEERERKEQEEREAEAYKVQEKKNYEAKTGKTRNTDKKVEDLSEDELHRELNNTFEVEDGKELLGENGKMTLQQDAEYRKYIDEHTGPEFKNKRMKEKIDTLSKAAAAYMLVKATTTEKFSRDLIHTSAGKIKQTLDIANLHESEIDEMLKSPETLQKGVNNQLAHLYAPGKNFGDYIKKMKTLSENLMTDDNRSAEYKNMVKYIKEVAGMNPSEAEAKKDEIILKNYKLMQAIEKYMKGKKRVRKTDIGVEHFDNALDALSIMNDFNPSLNDKVDSIVDRINEVRGSEASDHKDHVSIKEYGAERAIKAKEARVEKEKSKKLEKTLDKDKLKKKQIEHKLGM
jgi:hypothetical protein